MNEPREKDVQKLCLDWLRLWGAVVVRVNSGGMKIGNRYVKFNDQPGCSDAVVCLPDGRFLALEIKRPGRDRTAKRRKLEQTDFRARIAKSNGLAIVVNSLEQLRLQLQAAGYDTETQHA